eukprot:CAMPEP_0184857522 /NCGR_PEP_ID=MMETSP0580-20130426/2673_1 /TAXON_ID=1118495 /ORGANISM="Dactyliosolen fragilissimus" /LENGTH=1135 /DNA_ID=CAMNT_0027353161 /DNA_START=197 /DNA_END=3600 /DNA_ORIENTATION=+
MVEAEVEAEVVVGVEAETTETEVEAEIKIGDTNEMESDYGLSNLTVDDSGATLSAFASPFQPRNGNTNDIPSSRRRGLDNVQDNDDTKEDQYQDQPLHQNQQKSHSKQKKNNPKRTHHNSNDPQLMTSDQSTSEKLPSTKNQNKNEQKQVRAKKKLIQNDQKGSTKEHIQKSGEKRSKEKKREKMISTQSNNNNNNDNNMNDNTNTTKNIDENNKRNKNKNKNNNKNKNDNNNNTNRNNRKSNKSNESSNNAESYEENTNTNNSEQLPSNKNGNSSKVKKEKRDNKKSTSSSSTNKTKAIPPNQPQLTNDLNYRHGEKINVLHIAEKPSIGQAIAKGLSKSNSDNQYTKGSLPILKFTKPDFPKAPMASTCTHIVTSVAGHVFNVDFPQKYQSWDSVDPAELFHAPIQKKPCKGSIVKHLQDCARGTDFIVLWLDCDREGENIAFEVLDCCMHLMRGSNKDDNYNRVYRAYFSAINPSDIQKAYHSLGKPDKNQSLSVDARQELDLKVGVAFSRFQTRYFQGRYGDLDSAILSYGPCQTPTLGFCVKRHIDIETFKPEPYWTLDLAIYKRGKVCRALWESGRSFNRNKVMGYVKDCLESQPSSKATVASVVKKNKKQGRPVPLNTVSLLKACSKALGIGPHLAMQTAERLYLSGYLSYPRTESSTYPKSFDIKGTLQAQANDSRWGNYVCKLLQKGHTKARGGIDMGDHPPITPCRAAGVHELSGDMARVFDLVTRHFIASVSEDAVWQSTKVSFNIKTLGDKGQFSLRGKQLVSAGFLEILLHKEYGDERDDTRSEFDESNDDDDEEERAIPDFCIGEDFTLTSSSSSSGKVALEISGARASLGVKEKMTTPPTHLSESELINQMEKHGIGTDASIATHIENIQKRNYVELIPGRKMMPSKLGLVLAQGYHLIDSSLVLPKIRSDIEGECNKIAKGLANKNEVIKMAIDLFESRFENFVKNINKMDVLFSSSFSQLKDIGKPFTRCGLTRRYLQYIPGPPPRLYNKFTEIVYPLPAGGIIKEWTGRKCSVVDCNFELCLYSVGQPERTFPLCPNCFNNPKKEWGKAPGDDEEAADDPVDREDELKEKQIRRLGGKSLILECPHPDLHPLIEELTVSYDDSDGALILDPHFGPKW